jgi:ParB-like chromosome segregation protein Spo0J
MTGAQDIRSMGRSTRVALADLRLDPHNPRLPAALQGGSQEDLAIYLELGFEALPVAESIASHGFFGSEPLIVIDGDEAGTWTVVEGNRRLTALLGLADQALRGQFANPTPWDELAVRTDISLQDQIPVVVLADRAAATPIIGFRHISGILQWQPYAQARYIAKLIDEEGMTFGEVAEMVGIDRTRVGNLYRDQAIANQASGMGIDTQHVEETFSLLTVAMSTTKLRDHVAAPMGSKMVPGSDPIPSGRESELRELLGWIYGDEHCEPVISDSREISRLGNVVAHEIGLRALRSGESLESAAQRVKDAEVDPRDRLLKRLRVGRNSLLAAAEDIDGYPDDAEVVDAVGEARDAIDALQAALDS